MLQHKERIAFKNNLFIILLDYQIKNSKLNCFQLHANKLN